MENHCNGTGLGNGQVNGGLGQGGFNQMCCNCWCCNCPRYRPPYNYPYYPYYPYYPQYPVYWVGSLNTASGGMSSTTTGQTQ
jgi:hypothetical protein